MLSVRPAASLAVNDFWRGVDASNRRGTRSRQRSPGWCSESLPQISAFEANMQRRNSVSRHAISQMAPITRRSQPQTLPAQPNPQARSQIQPALCFSALNFSRWVSNAFPNQVDQMRARIPTKNAPTRTKSLHEHSLMQALCDFASLDRAGHL